jgi:hypothetical protein
MRKLFAAVAAVGLAASAPTVRPALAESPAAPAAPSTPSPSQTAVSPRFEKVWVEKKFRSEGVAVADVNKDGKPDIIVGDVWFEAPDWKPHEIRKPGNFGDGAGGYSQSFAVWADDVNADGWPDVIVVGFPGAPVYWYENPQNKPGPDEKNPAHWKRHEIWHSGCNETPQYLDLFGDGKRVLLMGWQPQGQENAGQMAWFEPAGDPTQKWVMHPVSEAGTPTIVDLSAAALAALKADGVAEAVLAKLEPLKDKKYNSAGDLFAAAGKALTPEEMKEVKPKLQKAAVTPGRGIPGTHRFAHGLGAGDVNGDGKLDVIVKDGWWEQPAEGGRKATGPWKWHAAPLGSDCSDMYAMDLDGDGLPDVISSAAHGLGTWWHRQVPGSAGAKFETKTIQKTFSQTHAMHLVDLFGDGHKGLVTGKRFWAHGPKGDVDPGGEVVLYWIGIKPGGKGSDPAFEMVKLDGDGGVGTQFAIADLDGDGKLDIIVSS